MKIEQVVNAVRQRLGDIKKERWSDLTLSLYTSLAQQDICIQTNFYKTTTDIQLEEGKFIYELPSDCLHVDRLEYMGQYFPIESRMAIDDGTAKLPCALKDNLQYNQIEIVLGDTDRGSRSLFKALQDAYGVVTDSDTDAIDTSDCELQDTYGVVSDVDDPTIEPEQPSPDILKVYYSAVPPPKYFEKDDLIIPDIWFIALLHYVTGMALQDDNDAANSQRGEFELKKYQRQLSRLAKITAKDHTSNVRDKLTISPRRV